MTLTNGRTGALALMIVVAAATASAQTTLTGTRVLDERLDDITDDVQTDIDRANDDYRFGNPEYRKGLSGSAALGYSGADAATDSQEFDFAARLRFAQGQLVQTIGVVLEYSEIEGSRTKSDVFAVYDANYYLNDRLYLFALARIKTDGLAELATETKNDAFIGVGPGYRIVNTPDVGWRVQAGLGVSYLENGVGEEDTELGGILSSRVFYRVTESFFVTNDTDILTSDSALRVNNDLGLNFRMADAFVTRLSYLSDYNDSRDQKTENRVGVSLVYGF